ncbi:MAG: RIP metalloprotease RseP [Bacteroidales bacterium]|jgi:regulator of sigma E protease|nr:RIP metalloprotease RseP [Bacteroidales bacterium]
MEITTQIIGFIASLSFLIFTHELGHYFFARLFKTRVNKFYLFFNPGFSILRAKNCGGKWQFSYFSKESPEAWNEYPDNTEWGIGWLPLGGYCAINGMVDETTKADELPEEPQPYEFRSKKTWQRFFIISGGVLVNFISALILYPILLFVWGKEYVPNENLTYGMEFNRTAKQAGFCDGDIPISADGKTLETINDCFNIILFDNPKQVVVKRNGEETTLNMPSDFTKQLLTNGYQFLYFNFPFVVDSVLPNTSAAQIGMLQGDSIVAIDNKTFISQSEMSEQLAVLANQKTTIDFYRAGQLFQDTITPDSLGKLGIARKDPSNFIKTNKENYTLAEAIPAGFHAGINTLKSYIKQFKLFAYKEGAKQMGGFISIGKIFPKSWDWQRFWETTALLAIILAFMNILPIPALDGGYLLFILVEMIIRRKPSDKLITYANAVGMTLLLLLILYANGMDIIRLFS